MKKSKIAFLSIALMLATPVATLCKKKSDVEVVRVNANISQNTDGLLPWLLRNDNLEYGTPGKKRVHYIYPTDSRGRAKKDLYQNIEILKKNNISVTQRGSTVRTVKELKKAKPTVLKVIGAIFKPEKTHILKGISLVSDSNKTIDIYMESFYLFNMLAFCTMSHTEVIAILIDENDTIVHILDDVKSEQEVLKAFGIK